MRKLNGTIQWERESRERTGDRGISSTAKIARGWQPLPPWAWAATAVLVLWSLFTANALITLFAVLMLPVFGLLLWRPGEPPVLVFACGMQWLQASAAIFYTNYYRTSLTQAFEGPELERATWLTLLA